MPQHQVTSPRRQRACLPCTKAKARCHYENDEIGDGCDRCQRSDIACMPQTTKSLRRPRRVKAKNTPEHAGPSKFPSQSRHELAVKGSDARANAGSGGRPGAECAATVRTIPPHSGPLLPESPALSDIPPGPGFGISWDQARKAVDDFTLIFTAHFPFIILDHDITPSRLSVEKPLLFQTILMIAIDFTPAKSREIKRSVDDWIGKHLLAMEEQSLDILQGLLVYISWSNPRFHSDHRATQLMYLAVGLVHSLGISRHAIADGSRVKSESEINEEHRAFLACYYILSFNSFQFGRSNPLSLSSAQYCVDSLERSAEFLTDFLLIKLIKFRQCVTRIPNVYEGLYDMNWDREISADSISYQLHEKRKELYDIMSDVAQKHHKFLLLWSLHNFAFLQLHMPMTYVVPRNEASSRLQLECMQYCLEVSQKFVSTTKSLSPDAILYAPFTTLTDMMSMTIALSRLLVVEIDGWDLKTARQSIDLKTAIDELLAKFVMAGKFKAERVAAAAVEYPSSYTPVDPDEEKQNTIQISISLLESIRDWLDDHGAFLTQTDENSRRNTPLPSTSVNFSPQSPQWTYTYFFESVIQIDRTRDS
ncbi:hypothetical protein F4861DRAFT_79841 [Xylaria intraflava]|nr:hypothetical protein F4861DRAFT_79841 [Xylaria intraflava]